MVLRLLFRLFLLLFGVQVMAQNVGTLTTTYTMEACGLNYTQGSVRLNKRAFVFSPQTGVTQPATITISTLPVCAVILKAYLYVGASGNGAPFTSTLTNPAQNTASFPMTVVGSDVDICWGFAGTYAYRADVTSIVNGNGSYVLSGCPTSTTPGLGVSDTDGATLFIIFQDPAQGYTGGIVLADGCKSTLNTPVYSSVTISGFSVCGTPTVSEHFMIMADLQQLGSTLVSFNAPSSASTSANYNKNLNTDKVWDFVSAPNIGPLTAGQSSANYGTYNFGSDCFAMMVVGSYYRTNCLQCVQGSVASPVITLTAVATVSCAADVTVNVSGGLAPYSYTWTGGVSTTSVASGIGSGQYNIIVNGSFGCGSATTSIEVITDAPPIMVNNATVCPGQTTSLTVYGGATCVWSGPGNFNSTSQTIPVTGANSAGTAAYGVTVTGANGCTASAMPIVTTVNGPTVTITASSTLICKGQTVTLTPMGAQNYTWIPSLSGTGTVAVTPSATTIYSLQGSNAAGCSNSGTRLISVNECTGLYETTVGTNDLSVFPNPGSGDVTMRATTPKVLRLTDALGRLISIIELSDTNNYSLEVKGLSPGVYFLTGQGPGIKLVVN